MMTEPNLILLSYHINDLAIYITELHFKDNPALLSRFGTAGKERCYEDAVFHLKFLDEALTMKLPDMYANYILWAAAMLKSRNIPETDLLDNLDFVQQAIHVKLGSQFSLYTQAYIVAAKEKLNGNSEEHISYINHENPFQKEVTDYLEFLLKGKRRDATDLIAEQIEKGISISDIYQYIFQVSQYEVGRLWQCNKITVAHEHYCTAATQQIMSGLYPLIFSTNRKGKTLVACSIAGELHELGIRMVSDIFEMDGWDTYYLGANMPDKQLIDALLEYRADVFALSVTLPTYISKAAALIAKIRNNEEFKDLKIMVGGYPFITNLDLWKNVAADAYAHNANHAIKLANQLVSH